jgi:hypothetical protein
VEVNVSKNRDKPNDISNTNQQLIKRIHTSGKMNWLGHRKSDATAKLDEMLLMGATIDELKAIRGAIDDHIYHLRREHGLEILDDGEIYRFISKK